jgi:hypothetical protein
MVRREGSNVTFGILGHGSPAVSLDRRPPRRFPENASSQSVRTSCRAARNDQRTAPRGWETVNVPVGPPPHRAMARRPYLSIDGPPVDFPKMHPHKVSEHRAEPRGMTNGPRHGAGKL